jgi:NitT/TauT family transport system substrate-binding protein
MVRRAMTVVVTAGVMLGVAACGSDEPAKGTKSTGSAQGDGELSTLKIALAPTTDYAALYAGLKDGTFKKHGLDIQIKQALTATANMAAVTSGKADLATNSAASGSTGIINGLPLKMITATDMIPTEGYVEVLVRKDSGIKDFGGLAGKTVATINLQGLFELAVRNAVAKQGGDPKSVKTLAMAPNDEGPALAAKRLDGIILQDPFLAQAKRNKQFVSLGNPFSLLGYRILAGALFSSNKAIAEKGDALRRFREALTEASEKTKADPSLARQVIPEYTDLEPAVAETIGLPNYGTEAPEESMTKMLEQMKANGWIKRVPSYDELVWSGE